MRHIRSLAAVAAITGVALIPAGARASTFTVTTTADEHADPAPGAGCSLREAITAANTDGSFGGCAALDQDLDLIVLAPGATYSRTMTGANEDNAAGDYDVIESLSISAIGSVIEGTRTAEGDRVFDIVAGGSFSLVGGTIRNGNGISGGGVRTGQVTEPDLTLIDVTVHGNIATGALGAGRGGGILAGGDLELRNVTISDNTAEGAGGGLGQAANRTALLNNVTVSGNRAPNGAGVSRLDVGPGPIELSNTLVAGNVDDDDGFDAPDCLGSVSSRGHNLIGDTSGCDYTSASGDLTDLAPGLGPLGDNGGTNLSHALLPGSPAIDAGSPLAPGSGSGACELVDGRRAGVLRPQGSRCDIGAFEAVPAPPAAPPAPAPAAVDCGGRPATLVGTAGRDALEGTRRSDVIAGLGGRDTIRGLAGNDVICGGPGRDVLRGGAGKDRLLGQGGRDRLIGGKGRDRLVGGKGKDKVRQ